VLSVEFVGEGFNNHGTSKYVGWVSDSIRCRNVMLVVWAIFVSPCLTAAEKVTKFGNEYDISINIWSTHLC